MKTLWSSLPLLLLASCAAPSLDPASSPAATARSAGTNETALALHWWDGQSGTPALQSWWRSFQDPELSQLIHLALQKHPDLAAAAAAVREARAQREVSRASLFPSLDFSSNGGAERTWSKEADTTRQSFTANLSASWEVDYLGKNQWQVESAQSGLRVAEANLNAAQASLAAETALAYLQLRAAEKDLQLVRESIRSQEETTQLARWRHEAGQSDSLASDQAQSALASSRASQTALQQSTEQLRNRLTLLTGQEPGKLTLSQGRALPLPQGNLAQDIPADTIRQRPDVRAAGFRWLQAIAQTEALATGQFPSLTLSGSLGVNSSGLGQLFNPQALAGNLIAGVMGPLFDAGRIRSQIEGQSAAEEQAFHSYRTALLTALSEVTDALLACRHSEEQIADLESAVTHARQAAELAAQKYEAGVIDITQVLDTQRNEISLQRQLASTELEYASAHVELYRAFGGGW
ncbi:efflux transporter outer membrane subunit [Roseibacillus ishigakijimensis]|uniref:Efflux transporter outer membrane subunit n=1 Tax=Roseibacillus ishigakijimensis TaxID=454146 RepID=A0A934RNN4_9BACT|nr:efflux transporter outer membrane subunit [Roseibacillus ishigakijimensis]MBK1834158.1 efflux transporter outer membrane subunit [Roseibacillus ishigakijimensis]